MLKLGESKMAIRAIVLIITAAGYEERTADIINNTFDNSGFTAKIVMGGPFNVIVDDVTAFDDEALAQIILAFRCIGGVRNVNVNRVSE